MQSHTAGANTRHIIILASLLALGGCGAAADGNGKAQAVPQVGFRVVQPTTVPIDTVLPGRVVASQTAEVRPQVSGIIEKRLFVEGGYVRKGQPLFEIDPSLYRAAAAQALANLASAQANAEAAQAKADRYRPLAQAQAVASQDYTDAAAAARQAKAGVAQSQAAVNTARINLRFTTVPAPISGRIGRSLLTQGALATTSQTDPLAVITALDPVYVDIQESAADLVKLRRRLAAGGSAPLTADVRLTLDDGSDYGIVGKLAFSEVTVDPTTGTVTLRAHFANPQALLLPGMFVQARLSQSTVRNAYLVPQSALSRDSLGGAQVYVVGKDNKAVARSVTTVSTKGTDWVVTSGLNPGDRVITQGLGKVKPGQPVQAIPDTTPQVPGTAAAPAGKR